MNIKNISIAIIGASIGGLSSANILQRLGCKIKVFEPFLQAFITAGERQPTIKSMGSLQTVIASNITTDCNFSLVN